MSGYINSLVRTLEIHRPQTYRRVCEILCDEVFGKGNAVIDWDWSEIPKKRAYNDCYTVNLKDGNHFMGSFSVGCCSYCDALCCALEVGKLDEFDLFQSPEDAWVSIVKTFLKDAGIKWTCTSTSATPLTE